MLAHGQTKKKPEIKTKAAIYSILGHFLHPKFSDDMTINHR